VSASQISARVNTLGIRGPSVAPLKRGRLELDNRVVTVDEAARQKRNVLS
jgi:hypothetical protein